MTHNPRFGGSHVTDPQDVQSWRGMKMVDPDGDTIGTIEDIFLDRQTGEPGWAAVKTGLFGLKNTVVPIRDAQPTDDGKVRVPVQKEKVKDAPRIDPDGELDPEQERRLWEYYRLSDSDEWQGDDKTRAPALPDEAADRARREASAEAGEGGGGNGAPRIVGVRLRRVVVVAAPVGAQDDRT